MQVSVLLPWRKFYRKGTDFEMKIFDLDSPLMNFLGKMADLMWLNILTMLCCIPFVTAGASLTAMHYMALKIVRNEECYITKGFFKSFKENFKQATLIWFIMVLVLGLLIGDYYIILKAEIQLHNIFKIVILMVTVFVVFTSLYVFPTLAKFENTIRRTIMNSFVMSILQFPKTILMIVLYAVPIVLLLVSYQAFPFVFLFGMSAPALASAFLYNKFFKKLEDQLMEGIAPVEKNPEEEDERIFKDELDESITVDSVQ